MIQPDFIMMAKKVGIETVTQTSKIVVELRPEIRLTHNYKRKDEMCIVFLADEASYKIPSRRELEYIYRMHLEQENLVQPLRTWCDEHLKKS